MIAILKGLSDAVALLKQVVPLIKSAYEVISGWLRWKKVKDINEIDSGSNSNDIDSQL